MIRNLSNGFKSGIRPRSINSRNVANVGAEKGRFSDKSTWELIRGLIVLKTSSYQFFTKNAEKLYWLSTKLIGKTLSQRLLKVTFYGHFVAGDRLADLERVSNNLRVKENIKTMLCPPMEDLDWFSSSDASMCKATTNASRYSEYLHTASMLNSAQAVKSTILQFKPSSIFPSQCLDELSKKIDQSDRSFENWCYGIHDTIKNPGPSKMIGDLTPEIRTPLEHGLKLCCELFKEANERGLQIVVDGELRSSYAALQTLVLAFNLAHRSDGVTKPPLLYSTFQTYLKDSPQYLSRCMEFSKKNKVCLGVKVVRGAYMLRERRLAKESGYPDPIFDSYEKTSQSFDHTVQKLLESAKSEPKLTYMFVASHNESSINMTTDKMKILGIRNSSDHVKFAQIFGMCDYLSFRLAKNDYIVYKSIPWGPVADWVPYLARRASENYSAFRTSRNEMPHYKAEIKRRLFG